MRKLSKYILLLPILLLFFAPTKISKGCGPYNYGFYGYSFLNPKIINLDAKYVSYFAGFEEIFKQTKPKIEIQERNNLAEWHERFCKLSKPKDIHQIVYKSPIRQLQVLRTRMSQKKATLPPFFVNNTFAAQLFNSTCREAVDYLIYAKKCEPHVISTAGWKTTKRDTISMAVSYTHLTLPTICSV